MKNPIITDFTGRSFKDAANKTCYTLQRCADPVSGEPSNKYVIFQSEDGELERFLDYFYCFSDDEIEHNVKITLDWHFMEGTLPALSEWS